MFIDIFRKDSIKVFFKNSRKNVEFKKTFDSVLSKQSVSFDDLIDHHNNGYKNVNVLNSRMLIIINADTKAVDFELFEMYLLKLLFMTKKEIQIQMNQNEDVKSFIKNKIKESL